MSNLNVLKSSNIRFDLTSVLTYNACYALNYYNIIMDIEVTGRGYVDWVQIT
jgi:hypothetical protein